jgi:hypothetical protein
MDVAVEISGKIGRLKAKLGKVSAEWIIEKVCSSVITALSGMDDHRATVSLVEIAVLAPQDRVRRRASEALRSRPRTSYMPLLLASLTAPLESTFTINVMPSGHVTLVEDIYEEGPLADSSQVRSSNYATHVDVSVQGKRRRDNAGRELPTSWASRTIANPARDIMRATSRAETRNR